MSSQPEKVPERIFKRSIGGTISLVLALLVNWVQAPLLFYVIRIPYTPFYTGIYDIGLFAALALEFLAFTFLFIRAIVSPKFTYGRNKSGNIAIAVFAWIDLLVITLSAILLADECYLPGYSVWVMPGIVFWEFVMLIGMANEGSGFTAFREVKPKPVSPQPIETPFVYMPAIFRQP